MRAYERHIIVRFGVQDQSDAAVEANGEDGATMFSDSVELYWPQGKKRYIEFKGAHAADAGASKGECKIWNLGDRRLKKLYDVLTQIGVSSESEECDSGFVPWLEFLAGYGEWTPVIFTGKITGLPVTQYDGADTVTTFQVVDDVKNFLRWKRADGSFPPGSKYSDIVDKLIQDLNLPLGEPVELGEDKDVKEGMMLSPDMGLREALAGLAEATGSVFFVKNSHVYFIPAEKGMDQGLELTPQNGLIWTVTPVHKPQWGGNEDVAFTCLLSGVLKQKGTIRIKSEEFTGAVTITEIEYVVNQHDYYCNCKATLEGAGDGAETSSAETPTGVNIESDGEDVPVDSSGISYEDFGGLI
jgi:hypothetical protein